MNDYNEFDNFDDLPYGNFDDVPYGFDSLEDHNEYYEEVENKAKADEQDGYELTMT